MSPDIYFEFIEVQFQFELINEIRNVMMADPETRGVSLSLIEASVSGRSLDLLEKVQRYRGKIDFSVSKDHDQNRALSNVFERYYSFVKQNHRNFGACPEATPAKCILYPRYFDAESGKIAEKVFGETQESDQNEPKNKLEEAFWNYQRSIERYYASILALGFISKSIRSNEPLIKERENINRALWYGIHKAKYYRMQFAIMLGEGFLEKVKQDILELNSGRMSIMQHLEPFGQLPGSYSKDDEENFRALIQSSLTEGRSDSEPRTSRKMTT